MPRVHVVLQGECLNVIAERYGFSDYRTIYEAAENKALRKRRPNPNVLFPGDRLVIPDRKTKAVQASTSRAHRFVYQRPRWTRQVKLKLQDASGEALADMPYKLVVGTGADRVEFEGTTDGSGLLEQELPTSASTAMLHIGRMVRQLRIGDLNPLRDTDDNGVSGVQARLQNLGYPVGRVDGVLGPRTVEAIRAFQRDQKMNETGELDDALLAALEKHHEC
jgi:N-acetylmuramoyl-L-alanine amidase